MSNLSTATQCSEQNLSVVITPAGRDPDDRRPASRRRILLSSGLPDERVCDAGADPGGLHVLPKPYGAAELAETRTD